MNIYDFLDSLNDCTIEEMAILFLEEGDSDAYTILLDYINSRRGDCKCGKV